MNAPQLWVWIGDDEDSLDLLRYVKATDRDILRQRVVADRIAALEADVAASVKLTEEEATVVRAVLDVAAGVLHDAGDALRSDVERARGLLMPATMRHDAGAAAHCQRCGRYTTDFRALRPAKDPSCPTCNCGERDYWTGSFVRPNRDAKWSLP